MSTCCIIPLLVILVIIVDHYCGFTDAIFDWLFDRLDEPIVITVEHEVLVGVMSGEITTIEVRDIAPPVNEWVELESDEKPILIQVVVTGVQLTGTIGGKHKLYSVSVKY